MNIVAGEGKKSEILGGLGRGSGGGGLREGVFGGREEGGFKWRLQWSKGEGEGRLRMGLRRGASEGLSKGSFEVWERGFEGGLRRLKGRGGRRGRGEGERGGLRRRA